MKNKLQFKPEDKEILRGVYNFARARKAKLYLVGGALRDLLAGREKENPDFDFCIKKGAISFGRKLAKELKGGFVVLDKENGACRIVKKAKAKIYTLDFTDFRGKTLEEDLLHRDFTINAMALELEKVFKERELDSFLIDPYKGREGLEEKIVKVVNKEAFSEDPLRILRAFSLSSIFGFKIDDQTLQLAKKEKAKLSAVSLERVRDELFKIFHTSFAYEILFLLDQLKILKIIFPEIEKMRNIGQGPYHHLDVWQHTLETVHELELLLNGLRNNKDIQSFLSEVVSPDRKRAALLKLAALLHDIGKPATLRREKGKITFHGHEGVGARMAQEISRRLKLSSDETNSLRAILVCHLRPGFLADNVIVTPRAKFRFFRDAKNEAVSVLLLSISDQRATKGPLTTKASRAHHEKVVFALIKEHFKKSKEKKAPRLITGDDLIAKFKLEPSPLIGKVLSELEEAQAIGRLKSKSDALKLASKLLPLLKKA